LVKIENLDERYTYTHGYLRSALDISSAQRELKRKKKRNVVKIAFFQKMKKKEN